MNTLKRFPFFLFLIPIFFVLHGWLENYGFIEIKEIFLIFSLVQGSVILLFLCLFYLSKKNVRISSVTSAFISLWYLFFGVLIDFFRSLHFIFISSYTFLIPACIILTVLLKYILKKKTILQHNLFYYLNILLFIYCIVDGTLLAKKYITNKVDTAISLSDKKFNSAISRPNTYLMIFDEYAGYKSLNDSFNYKNDSLYTILTKNNFNLLPYFSNYDFTLFSVSSIVNMQYVPIDYDKNNIDQKDLQRRVTEIRNGVIFKIFSQNGYKINNYSIFDIDNEHGISNTNTFLPVHSILITDKILHNRFLRTSGFIFTTGKFGLAKSKKKYIYEHDRDNLKSEENLLKQIATKNEIPQFTYTHFLLPHAPFYRDSVGSYISEDIVADESNIHNKKLYLSYLKYTNQVIKKIVDSLSYNDPSAIVILMSDHGFRSYDNRFTQPYVFNNFVAVKTPGYNSNDSTSQRSNVNLFRFILNTCFKQSIPYLKDSSIILQYRQ